MTSSSRGMWSGRWAVVAILAALALLVLLSAACSSQSPNIGRYYKGRILHISVADL